VAEAKRFCVRIKNSKDNLTYVTFPDLIVRYTSGWNEPLKIKEGQEIPISACDSEDVRKSWLAGSLKKYTDSGWIEEIIDPPQPKPLTPLEILAIKAATPIVGTGNIPFIDVPIPPKPVSDVSGTKEVKPNLPEAQSTLSNFSLVKSYEDFSKLSYFLKLRFIKESNNKELLKEILSKTDSHQFKNNIQVKLSH
jgi:hypothetical protein